jgi:hypothetical protein
MSVDSNDKMKSNTLWIPGIVTHTAKKLIQYNLR